MKNTLLALALLLPFAPSAQIRLTEVAPTNTGQLADEDGDRPDWLEIQNQGLSLLSLSGWGLSDGGASTRWPLPALDLAPGERLLVFASGKNRSHSPVPSPVNHWETAINEGDDWRYLVGTANPPADWAELGFDDSAWPSGPGGFGYGDGDDATQLPDGTLACYLRRTFQAADTAQLARAILSMDYDDGFAAYLNGSPIARSSNLPTGPLQFDTPATPDHEAALFGGGTPESFPLDAALFQQLLRPGSNVLAIEVHNASADSSDLLLDPILILED